MRGRILIAVTAAIFIASCAEQPAVENEAIVSANSPAPVEQAGTASPAERNNAVFGPAVSGEQAKTLMHERHEGMEEIGDAMKAAGRWAKNDNRDFVEVREAAATIARLAPQTTGWFPPGTGPDVGKTEAKAAIWENPEDFAAKMANFQQVAQAFNVAAQGDDHAAVIKAQGDLGKSCKACHDLYREEH